jgi:hypothetical protein
MASCSSASEFQTREQIVQPISALFVAPSKAVLTMGVYHGWTLRAIVDAARHPARGSVTASTHFCGAPPPAEYLLWLCRDEARWKHPTPELINIYRGLRQLERGGCCFFLHGTPMFVQVNAAATRTYRKLRIEELLDTALVMARLLSHRLPAPIAARIAQLAVVCPDGLHCRA